MSSPDSVVPEAGRIRSKLNELWDVGREFVEEKADEECDRWVQLLRETASGRMRRSLEVSHSSRAIGKPSQKAEMWLEVSSLMVKWSRSRDRGISGVFALSVMGSADLRAMALSCVFAASLSWFFYSRTK